MGAIAKAHRWQDGFWRWMEDNSSNGSRRSQAGSSRNQTASIWVDSSEWRAHSFIRSRGAPALCLESTAFRIYGSYGRCNTLVVFTDHRFSPAPPPRLSLPLWSQSKYYFPEGGYSAIHHHNGIRFKSPLEEGRRLCVINSALVPAQTSIGSFEN